MSKSWFLRGVIISLLLGGVLASCSDPVSKPLRIGLNAWPGFAVLFVAEEEGFFADEGVNVELVELTSLSDVRRAFERRQVEGMATSLVEVLGTFHARTRPVVIGLVVDYSDGADVILAGKNIPDMAALVGRRVGVEPGTLNQLLLMRALELSHLTLDAVTIVNVSQHSMADVFSRGEVDAVVTYPPISSQILRDEAVGEIFNSGDIPGEIVDVISFDAETVAYRRDDIEAFKRAWARAVSFVREQPQKAYELISRHTGMTVAELETAYQDIELVAGDMQEPYLAPSGPVVAAVDRLQSILWPAIVASPDSDTRSLFVSTKSDSPLAAGWK